MRSEVKVIGVHDDATYKPMMVFKVVPENDRERRIMARAGFGDTAEKQSDYIFFYDMNHRECDYGWYRLGDKRTCGEAAPWIRTECGFDMLPHGAFIDCEFLRGDKDEPMTFEDEFDNYWR